MSQPLITIGIPVYNRADLITETVHSALSQTYQNIEIVINDNQSTDDTWAVLQRLQKEDARIRISQNAENIGAVRNWQEVYKHARGEYFHMLWSDDIIKPEFIEETYASFTEDTAFAIVANEEFDEHKIIHSKKYGFSEISTKAFLLNVLFFNKKGFPVSPVVSLFRTKDLQDNIIYQIPNTDNIDFNRTGAGPDLLFFLLVAQRYKKIKIIDKVLLRNRNHADSITIIESKKLGLRLNYDWAKYFFISTYFKKLQPAYKAYITFRNYKYNKQYANMLLAMKSVGANFLSALYIYITG